MHEGPTTFERRTSDDVKDRPESKARQMAKRFGRFVVSSWNKPFGNDAWTVNEQSANRDFFAAEYMPAVDTSNTEALGAVALAEAAINHTEELDPTYRTITEIGAATYTEKMTNDDSHVTGDNFAAVCDGVGSSVHGGDASRLVTTYLRDRLPIVNHQTSRKAAKKQLRGILSEAHSLTLHEQELSGRTMASTASTLSFVTEEGKTYAVIANIGDSPIYRVRNGETKELTSYHGHKFPKPALRPALGKPITPTPNIFNVRVKPGDSFVLTSNGIRKNDEKMKKIKKVTNRHRNPNKIASKLARDIRGESHDARTAVVVQYKQTIVDSHSLESVPVLIAA